MGVVLGDITELDCECIVNAANSTLLGGGGVNGAIHRAAGPKLREECRLLNGCRTGEAKLTKGYRLKAKNIIHTVGPVYDAPDADEMLGTCYWNCLELARENEIHSIAFPMISTGKFKFPKAEAAKIALLTVLDWKREYHPYPMEIIFCCFEDESFGLISRYFHDWKQHQENLRSETEGIVFHKIKLQFYPEDEELMAKMSVREKIEYIRKLKDENRYIVLGVE